MKNVLKNWKSTSAGLLMIAGAISMYLFHNGPMTHELFMGALTGLLGGIGLIFSKDADVTGVDNEN
jgi:hypothetical protein